MLLSQLLFAATAASFLVVPDASILDEDVVRTLPADVNTFNLPPTAFSQGLDVPCRKCKGRDAHLKMDFAVEDGSRLTLNGFELYPNADPWHGDLTASVVKANGKDREQRLGYSLAVKPEGWDEEQQMEVIGVELRVIEVGNRFVDGIPSVKVKLVKTPNRQILIGSLDITETAPSKCLSMWCRAKERFGHAFKGFGGCSKSRHGHAMHGESDAPKRPGHPGRPGRPAHHRASHHRQWRHLLKNMASHIFLPVLMGITAGFGVAIFAMCLCRLAIRLTGLVNGDRQPIFLRCPRHQKARAAESARDEEKAALMADEELPQYKDASSQD